MQTIVQGTFEELPKLCDYYVINGPVDDTMESGAKNAVSKSDGGEECAIFLTTYGGSADVAYRVMRFENS